MGKFIDISGQRFGKLLVVSQAGLNKDNRMIWNLLCDCGITVQRTAKAIKKAKELYCGDMHPTKLCTKCKIEKNKKLDFHKAGKTINPTCKECMKLFYIANAVELRKKHTEKMKDAAYKEKIRIKSNRSRQKHKHKELAYKRVYEKRPEVIARRKRIHLDRKANDIQYNLRRRLRGRVRDCLKSLIGKHYKYKSSLLLLGCDMPFFKDYIESKFEYGMNWDRFTYIHIDHIIPCSQFDLTNIEEQKKCFHYTNMQPLWEVDNLTKSYMYNGESYPKR